MEGLQLKCMPLKLNLHQHWEKIKDGMKDIYKGNSLTKAAYMNFHTHVFQHCREDDFVTYIVHQKSNAAKTETLYNKINRFLTAFVKEIVTEMTDLYGEALLLKYKQLWNSYQLGSKALNSVCGTLNNWIKKCIENGGKDLYDVFQLTMMTWNNLVFTVHKEKLTTAMLKLIDQERLGKNVNMKLLGDTASSFLEMDKYSDRSVTGLVTYQLHFEVQFLETSKAFYLQASDSFRKQYTILEYTTKFQKMLVDEEMRCHLFLHETTFEKLMKIFETVVIQRHLEAIEQEFKACVVDQRNDDLGRLYSFAFRFKESLVNAKYEFETHVYTQGMCTVEGIVDVADNKFNEYVAVVAALFLNFEHIVKVHLKNDSEFKDVLYKAGSKFVNDNAVTNEAGQSPSEQLACYCDMLLNNGKNSLDVDKILEILGNVMIVFNYIEDKIAFRTFYSRMLATRLLQDGTINEDAETFVISKLKQVSGFGYTWNMQEMMQDIALSKTLNMEFNEWMMTKTIILPYKYHVNILSAGAWPLSQSGEFTIPKELEQGITRFNQFYISKYDDRRLSWLHNRSKGEIVSNCFKNQYIFKTSAFQMSVLLMFNINDKYKIGELAKATKLKIDILIQVLRSLLTANLLLLPDKENEADLVENTNIEFCPYYQNQKKTIELDFPLQPEVKREKERSLQQIESDKNYVVQSAIVRIMKMRNQLKHHELVTEVISKLVTRFNPSVALIKRNIDNLIDKEYIMRCVGDKDAYNYII